MNTFRNAFNAPVLDRGYTRTTNGMKALKSTLNANVDLFASIGALRGRNVLDAFSKAFKENADVAIRLAQHARDIRGGMGERQIFRDIILHLEVTAPVILLESNLIENIPNIGRWDDLLIFRTPEIRNKAFRLIAQALIVDENSLCAKWMPRKGPNAIDLRNYMGLSPKSYRKMLVRLTNVVETSMCNREFSSINFSHVPSVAMSRYLTAFYRNAPEAFASYREALKRNDGTAKVNAGAVYPYDIVAMAGGATEGTMENHSSYFNSRSRINRPENIVAQRMWEALPDYMNDVAVLPIVDVSGSMAIRVPGKSNTRVLDVAVSLGLYCAERTKNTAFKNLLVTFSNRPTFFEVSGTLAQRLDQVSKMTWGSNTNLHAVLDLVLNKALEGRVPEAEMPKVILIMSDMQFDQCARFDNSAMQMIRSKYEASGYQMPSVVFWNLNDGGNKPVRFNEKGVALISGFSPSVMKSVLSGADLDKFSPENIMLQTLMVDRYNW